MFRKTIRCECKDCGYKFIAPIITKCPKCKSSNLIKIEDYIEKAPLQ